MPQRVCQLSKSELLLDSHGRESLIPVCGQKNAGLQFLTEGIQPRDKWYGEIAPAGPLSRKRYSRRRGGRLRRSGLETRMLGALNGRNWQRARRAKFFAIQIADNSSDISDGLGVGRKAVILLNTLRSSVVGRQDFGKVVVIVHQVGVNVVAGAGGADHRVEADDGCGD